MLQLEDYLFNESMYSESDTFTLDICNRSYLGREFPNYFKPASVVPVVQQQKFLKSLGFCVKCGYNGWILQLTDHHKFEVLDDSHVQIKNALDFVRRCNECLLEYAALCTRRRWSMDDALVLPSKSESTLFPVLVTDWLREEERKCWQGCM